MPAQENRRRRSMFDAEPSRALEKPVHRVAVKAAGLASEAVGFRDAGEQFEVDLLSEPPEGAVADFIADLVPGAGFEMLRDQAGDLLPYVVAVDRSDVDPIEQRERRRHSLPLMIHRADA